MALKDMRARLDEFERAAGEPIAIIGMGCRFPGGAVDPASFWRQLRDGCDAVGEVPLSRWDSDEYYDPNPDVPGKMNTRWGGFLRDSVDAFDARFFGIMPREAASMDPQQRLLLEVAWEALEHAGRAPASLNGSDTGVFTGISTNDYSRLWDRPESVDSYMSTGNAFSVAAGRLSYILGLHGPSLAVDTACSSSLVAVHLAVQSLRSGECRMALAAGVNLILSPLSTLALSHLRMMAADGRCKTFDAAADGFVRGEGCGVVVLKRLRDALGEGDNIIAVIRGTAVNQDGRSGGLTAPNGPAQEAVIRRALANAGIAPAAVDYVEAHGTGTSLGDPIECKALAAVLGEGRPSARKLLLGSVKTNIGHLEAAAGMAGLIKVALALSHREIPPHLHFRSLNPHISFGDLLVEIPTKAVSWPSHEGPAIAGLSSFGFSGTNAHLVLEEAPRPVRPAEGGPPHLLCLSARTEAGLVELAARFRAYLAGVLDRDLHDVCATAAAGRSHFEHRLAIVAADVSEARAALEGGRWISGTVEEGVAPKVAFVFTQDGDQPEAIAAARNWSGWNVHPHAVLGHGCGEFAAGVAAGIFLADDALRLGRGVGTISPQRPHLPFFSSRLGRRAEPSELGSCAFWQPPIFPGEHWTDCVTAVREEGCELFLYFGSRPAGAVGTWLPGTCSAPRDLLNTLARLYLAGAPVDWDSFYGRGYSKIPLPTYPFERRRHWLDQAEAGRSPNPGWLYDLEWHTHAVRRPELAGPREIGPVIGRNVPELMTRLGLDIYDRFLPEADALAVAYCCEALRQLGCDPSLAIRSDPEELGCWPRIAPNHRRLFRRIVDIVAKSGAPSSGDLEQRCASLEARYGVCHNEISLLASCGRRLADVLRGEIDPLHILFPAGSVAPVENIYQDSPFFRAMNTLVADAFSAALSPVTANAKLRVIEVGAGTGGATAYVLPRLVGRAEYTLTDVSSLFLNHTGRKFASYPFVRYDLLDIERDPAAQGYPDGSFDIVLAANVLHAAADLRRALHHVRRLLAPNGLIVLLEGTRPQPWADLIFGLTEGWWRFSDADLRESHPLLARSGWLQLLAECGFSDSVVVPGEDTPEGRASQQVLIVSRANSNDPAAASGSWAFVPDHTGVADALVSTLAGQAAPVALFSTAELVPAKTVLHCAVLDCPSGDPSATALDAAVLSSCASVLRLAQSLAQRPERSRLWVITRGAQKVAADEGGIFPAQAPVWGLGRVIGLEHPEIWGGLIDLDPTPYSGEAADILDIIRSVSDDDQFALRAGVAYVPRLVASSDLVRRPDGRLFRSNASYLITGGLGSLGLQIAGWMVRHGARHLILLGLTGAADRDSRGAAIRDLERLGAEVEVVQADVADADRIIPVVHRLLDASIPLKGIIHAAGVSAPQAIRDIDEETLHLILRPKIAGSWLLHQATKDRPLDFFVCFSSAAAIWGTAGGGHYAAANHFMDALAQHRAALGLPSLSVNWARWEGEGMASSSHEVGEFFDKIGLGAMPATQALDLMGFLIQSGSVQKTVAAVDWNIFRPVYEARRRRPLIGKIPISVPLQSEQSSQPGSLLDRLQSSPAPERWSLLLSFIRQQVSSVLGFVPGEEPALDQGFFKMGLDSLTSVELKTRLEAALGRRLPPTLAFEYSTIESLARYLYSEIFGGEPFPDKVTSESELEDLSEEDAQAVLLAELAVLKRELQ